MKDKNIHTDCPSHHRYGQTPINIAEQNIADIDPKITEKAAAQLQSQNTKDDYVSDGVGPSTKIINI